MKNILALTIAVGLGLAGSLHAQTTYTWNVTTGNWNVPGSWDPNTGTPSAAGDTAIINSSSAAVTLNVASLGAITVNQSAGTVSQNSSRTLAGTAWFLTGGTFSLTGAASSLPLNTSANLTVNGGTLSVGNNITLATGADFNLFSGSATAALLQLGSDSGNTATISSGTFTGNISAGANTVFTVSGGAVVATSSTFSGNPGALVNLTGGTFHAGALGLAPVSSGTPTEMNLSGSAKLTLSSITYTTGLALKPTWDFSSLWSGSVTLTGASTITDYWNAFTNNGSFNNVQIDNTLVNFTTFNSTFKTVGGVLIPEPSTWALLGAGFSSLLAFRRRRFSR